MMSPRNDEFKSLDRRGATSAYQRHNEQDQKNEKEKLRNECSRADNDHQPEHASSQRGDQEDDARYPTSCTSLAFELHLALAPNRALSLRDASARSMTRMCELRLGEGASELCASAHLRVRVFAQA